MFVVCLELALNITMVINDLIEEKRIKIKRRMRGGRKTERVRQT